MRRPAALATPLAKRPPRLLEWAVLLAAAAGESRRAVYGAIQRHPGLHHRELARHVGMQAAAVEHHLRHLVRAGLVLRERHGGFVRYYPALRGDAPVQTTAVGPAQRRVLRLLRQARPLQIVAHLLQAAGPVAMGDLAAAIGVSPGTLTYQVAKLEKAGIVERRPEGNQRLAVLVDREATVRVLLDHEPPADLVAGFQDLWDDVGL